MCTTCKFFTHGLAAIFGACLAIVAMQISKANSAESPAIAAQTPPVEQKPGTQKPKPPQLVRLQEVSQLPPVILPEISVPKAELLPKVTTLPSVQLHEPPKSEKAVTPVAYPMIDLPAPVKKKDPPPIMLPDVKQPARPPLIELPEAKQLHTVEVPAISAEPQLPDAAPAARIAPTEQLQPNREAMPGRYQISAWAYPSNGTPGIRDPALHGAYLVDTLTGEVFIINGSKPPSSIGKPGDKK